MKNNSGFSLIELLVTIVVLGILAAIALTAFTNQTDKARYAEAKLQMNAIAKDLQIALAENGSYPLDENPGGKPDGIDNWVDEPPYGVPFDYEHWIVARMPDGRRNCRLVMVTWAGKDGRRATPIHQALRSQRGLYREQDDLFLIVDSNDCSDEYMPGPVR